MGDDLQRRFFALALPNVASNLLVPLAGLTDVAMLGHFGGVDDLAGVALGTVLFNYLLWSFGFLRMGTTGLTAQAVGARDAQAALDVFTRGLALALGAGLVVVLARGPLATLGFALLEGSQAVEQSARAYYDARIFGAPLALSSFVLQGNLIGFGRARSVLLMSAANNLTNIVLDYALIAQLGMGASGAGYATVGAHAASCLVGLPLALSSAREHRAAPQLEALRDLSALSAFLKIGSGIFVRTLALVTGLALFTDFSALLGTQRLASNTLVLQVVTLNAFFVDGYAMSVETLAGQYYGAGQRELLGRVLRLAFGWGLLTAAGCSLAFTLWPEALFGVLTDHEELVGMASADALWLWPVLLFGSAAYVLDGFFIGLSAARILSRMMVLALLLGFVPLGLYARAVGSAGWLWMALVCFMAARTLTLGAQVPRTLRRAAQKSSS